MSHDERGYVLYGPVEYALYYLAVNEPQLLDEAERTKGTGMLANDETAAARVKAMIADLAR